MNYIKSQMKNVWKKDTPTYKNMFRLAWFSLVGLVGLALAYAGIQLAMSILAGVMVISFMIGVVLAIGKVFTR